MELRQTKRNEWGVVRRLVTAKSSWIELSESTHATINIVRICSVSAYTLPVPPLWVLRIRSVRRGWDEERKFRWEFVLKSTQITLVSCWVVGWLGLGSRRSYDQRSRATRYTFRTCLHHDLHRYLSLLAYRSILRRRHHVRGVAAENEQYVPIADLSLPST